MGYKMFIVTLLCCVCAATASQNYYTQCPKKDVIKHFNATRYGGLWYEIRRFPNFFEPNATCVTGDVSTDDDGNVWILDKWKNSYTSEMVALRASLRHSDPNSNSGKLLIRFNTTTVDVDYSILETDYDNYALLWSCIPVGIVNGVPQYGGYAWVLGRSVLLSDDISNIVDGLETEHNIRKNAYETTDHSDCVY